MKLSDLDYIYPPEMVATKPSNRWRCLTSKENEKPLEISKQQLLEGPLPGDLVLINSTMVEKRQIPSLNGFNVLFAEDLGDGLWSTLFPAKACKVGEQIPLAGGSVMTLIEKGIPQKVKVEPSITNDYFMNFGRVALPPYIQKRRLEVSDSEPLIQSRQDEDWYQADWAETMGSAAAPTASLHFSKQDLQFWESRGVEVSSLVLHVGMGTFLPIRTQSLEQHQMHKEWVSIPANTVQLIEKTKSQGGRVWALGTTVVRALESFACNMLSRSETGSYEGSTDLFIQPGYQFQVVDVLMTNFHQPKSSLLALVAAFAGQKRVMEAYKWAIEKRFRFFSYGDLTVWH